MNQNPGLIIEQLKNVHKGRRGFIVGNGPSLGMIDPVKMHNDITFTSNDIRRIFHRFKPTYWLIEDSEYFKFYRVPIWEVSELYPEITILLSNYDGPGLPNKYVTYVCNGEACKRGEYLFDGDYIDSFVHGLATVSYSALQLGWYMGIREFYLIGMDQVTPRTKNHFHPEYCKELTEARTHTSRWDIPEDTWLKGFSVAKDYIESRGGSIKNASPTGEWEIFTRVDYDSLF